MQLELQQIKKENKFTHEMVHAKKLSENDRHVFKDLDILLYHYSPIRL